MTVESGFCRGGLKQSQSRVVTCWWIHKDSLSARGAETKQWFQAPEVIINNKIIFNIESLAKNGDRAVVAVCEESTKPDAIL